MRESVVLPAPDGEERTNINPRRAMLVRFFFPLAIFFLFHVLNLLAELLHRGL
jgi:hypothetical protein